MEQATRQFIATVVLGGNAYAAPPGSGLIVDLKNPSSIATDQHGRLFVADTEHDCVRAFRPDGSVFTLESSQEVNRPWAMVVDPRGTPWVQYGTHDHRWAKVMPDGRLETVLEGRPASGASAIAFDG